MKSKAKKKESTDSKEHQNAVKLCSSINFGLETIMKGQGCTIISLLEKDLKNLSVFFEMTVIIHSVAVWGSLPHQHFPTNKCRKNPPLM